MNYPDAVGELFKILEIPDRNTGLMKSEDRKQSLYNWLNKYLGHIKQSQLVISSKELTIDNHEFICETIVHDCLDNIIESNLVRFTVEDHKYTAEMWALKSYKHIKK